MEGGNVVPKGRIIYYLTAMKMINKGCIYHLVRVMDTKDEEPTLESVQVVNEFPEVFLDELLGIPPDREIDFGIDVILGTQPKFIPPYKISPTKLKELKEQLKDLFEKGFIRLKSVVFLGHVVSREGIMVDPQKITTVRNWPRPTNPTDIHSFLVLAGYYRKFVEGFSTLASPLTKLMQKARKTNVVVDALSRRSMGSLAHLEAYKRLLAKDIHRLASLGVHLVDSSEGGVIMQNRVESSLVVEVKEKQYNDPLLVQLKKGINKHKTMSFSLCLDDSTLRYKGQLCVPNVDGLRERILTEAHTSRYFVHLGYTKMYHDLKKVYWWNDMKRNMADFVARCPNFQEVKAEHQ
ncbi:uncharacterized protein [Nicotiana sylvestris]|uniref:uncharacterized protein n=1 Tax=Nicotiana sylvestris TaxID=4096 RepID=UPI00388CCD3F